MTDPNEHGISGPPTAGDDAATLLGSLERQRAIFAWKVGGLDEKGLAAKVVGHADLIRETIDGLVGGDPPEAVYPYEPPARARPPTAVPAMTT